MEMITGSTTASPVKKFRRPLLKMVFFFLLIRHPL